MARSVRISLHSTEASMVHVHECIYVGHVASEIEKLLRLVSEAIFKLITPVATVCLHIGGNIIKVYSDSRYLMSIQRSK